MSKKKNNLNYIPASAKTAAQKKEEAKQNKRANLSPEARKQLLKKRAWTLSVISLSIVLVLTLSILFGSYVPTYYSEKTNTAPTETTDDNLIKNQDFGLSKLLYNGEVSSALQYPYLPEGWTLTNSSVDKTVAGIISRDDEDSDKVKEDLKASGITDEDEIASILTNTDATADDDDKNVLLVYNKESASTRAYSNSFTVAANTYVEITVKARTSIASGDGAFVSLKTSASDSATPELTFSGIKDSSWTEYKFIVEGSKTSSKTFYLFVGLDAGSTDTANSWAEFDFAKAEYTKKVSYVETIESETPSSLVKTKSYVENASDEDIFASVFDNSNGIMTGGTVEINATTDEYELPFYNADSLPVYKLVNTDTDSVNSTFMSLTNKLKVDQSAASPYYRLSFWAKTTDLKLETGAYFYAKIYEDGKPSTYQTISLVSTSEDADDVNSGWEEFSFLFKPDNNKSYEVEIVFALGELRYTSDGYAPAITDVDTTGSLYVTEFELKEIYPSEYSAATAGSNLAKVELTSSTSTGLITNGSFDSPVSNASYDGDGVPSGFDPNGWDIVFPRASTDDGYVYTPHSASDIVFGIVSKNSTDKATYLGDNFADYFGHTGDDNVLAVKVQKDTAIGFVSNKFTLSANSQYVISFLVKASDGAKVNAYLTGDVEQAFEIGSVADDKYYVYSEFDNGGYTKYNFVIKTGDKSKSVALELWVGDKNATYANDEWTGLAKAGTIVAFDEVSADSITADQFDDIVESKNANDSAVFTKTETKNSDDEITDVAYTTDKENVKVQDFTYADETGAIATDDTTEDEDDEEVVYAPINWLLLSSLILSVAVIIFLIAMIVRKFKKAQKHQPIQEDPDYKN